MRVVERLLGLGATFEFWRHNNARSWLMCSICRSWRRADLRRTGGL